MRKLDKGSALLITLMVLVVLSLTGLSFIFLADTENAISNNYYRAMTALVSAQTGVYAVNAWFNNPTRTADLVPTAADMVFTTRSYAPDGGGTATQWKSGGTVAGVTPFDKPYVGAIDSNTVVHQFFGKEETPDVVLDITNATSRAYMQGLNSTLFGVTYENASAEVPENGGVHISRIALYAPPVGPYPDNPTDARNQAYGICTALIVAETVNPAGQTVSTRRVRGIITDINYSVAGEALDVDGEMRTNGSVRFHWGNIKSTEAMEDNQEKFLSNGGPWYVSPTGTVGRCPTLMGWYDAATDTGFLPGGAVLQGSSILDPWLLIRSRKGIDYGNNGGQYVDPTCNGGTLKWPTPGDTTTRLIQDPMDDPFTAAANDENYSCDYYFDTADNTLKIKSYWTGKCKECTDPADPNYASLPGCPGAVCNPSAPDARWTPGSYTNFWACDPSVAFATAFRGYNYWKRVVNAIATQGGASSQMAKYLVAGGATDVNGLCGDGLWGPPGDSTNCKDVGDWTNGQKGFWFFDTLDGTVPKQNRSNIFDGNADLKGQYVSEGFLYLAVQELQASGGQKGLFEITMPGEPLWENPDPAFAAYRNGRYDGKVTIGGTDVYVDRFINLEYPDFPYDGQMNKVNPYIVNKDYEDASRNLTKGWDQYGPTVQDVDGTFHGIFYLTGDTKFTGSRAFWGSVMVWNSSNRNSGTVDVWYDPKLAEGLSNLGLPNSYIEQILTDM